MGWQGLERTARKGKPLASPALVALSSCAFHICTGKGRTHTHEQMAKYRQALESHQDRIQAGLRCPGKLWFWLGLDAQAGTRSLTHIYVTVARNKEGQDKQQQLLRAAEGQATGTELRVLTHKHWTPGKPSQQEPLEYN